MEKLKYYSSIKKYFINLDERTDRLEFTRAQLGNDLIRWSACNGKVLDPHSLEQLIDLKQTYKNYSCYQTYGQAACTISHYKLYENIANNPDIKDNDFVLICEDDNTYIAEFDNKLDQLLQFLNQEKFEESEIVILKYMEIREQIDYVKMLSLMKTPSLDKNSFRHLKQYGFTDYQVKVFSRYRFRYTLRVYPEHIFSFDYKNLKKEKDPCGLYTQTQHLFAVHKINPYSSSCYLIRKKTCKKIVNKYKKPFWFTDDFKLLVPLRNILLASPFLANDSNNYDDVAISSVSSDYTFINHKCNKLHKNKVFKYTFLMYKTFKFINSWNYSDNRIKRKTIKYLSKLLNI